jgi:hypothetical protein
MQSSFHDYQFSFIDYCLVVLSDNGLSLDFGQRNYIIHELQQ